MRARASGAMGDELARVAAEGSVAKLKNMLQKQDPKGKKIQEAVVAAASKGQFEAMKLMLEWGASPLSRDSRDVRAFIIACANGSLPMVALMIEHQADVNDRDKLNKTPMTAAIAGPHLDIVKALIVAGAEAPSECSVRGVGQAIWEARLDMATKQMKHYGDIQVSAVEISAVEDKAWIAMREHMRLLEMKEEKVAGEQLAKIQRLTKSEEDDSRRTERKAESLSEDLRMSRVQLQKEQSTLRDIMIDIDGVKTKHMVMEEEDERIRAEIQERKKELEEVQQHGKGAHEALRSSKSELDELNAEVRSFQDEIGGQTRRRASLTERLETTEAELAGWLRDKEAAAELTAQAHKLLGR